MAAERLVGVWNWRNSELSHSDDAELVAKILCVPSAALKGSAQEESKWAIKQLKVTPEKWPIVLNLSFLGSRSGALCYGEQTESTVAICDCRVVWTRWDKGQGSGARHVATIESADLSTTTNNSGACAADSSTSKLATSKYFWGC